MGDVIDFDAVRKSDKAEIILTAAGQYEQAAEAAVATLQTDSDQKDHDQAIATLLYLGAKLDELDASGVEIT